MSHDFHFNGLSPDEKVVELHTHSNISDGLESPEKLMQRAKRAGVRAISLTDHDTVAGLPRASAEAKRLGVEFIPGIEFTCDHLGRSVHLLGHFIRPDAPRLAAQIKARGSARVERMGEIIERLNHSGLRLDKEDFFAVYADSPSITRGQLGAYMLKKGFARSREEVFEKYIGDSAPCYVELNTLTPFDALELIHDAGGAATLAHPLLSGCDDVIPALAEAGLAGIEVEHPSQDADAQFHYRKMAEEYGLLCMGGSDCHGVPHKQDRLGQFSQPLRLLLELSKRAKTRRTVT
ncbi:MAG: PHP domain-containing protein [Nitrospinae bacterium]|nr:PHP domain-containing protein [Nitrospinota bacterium]